MPVGADARRMLSATSFDSGSMLRAALGATIG
jgi:hypothetical protein